MPAWADCSFSGNGDCLAFRALLPVFSGTRLAQTLDFVGKISVHYDGNRRLPGLPQVPTRIPGKDGGFLAGHQHKQLVGCSVVKAGRPKVFLSVLVPFDEGENAAGLAKSINTRVGSQRDITAKIGMVRVSLSTDGTRSVQR